MLYRRIFGLSLVLGAVLAACQSPSENEVGSVCPQCGPSSGGETGDFGPGTVDCDPWLMWAELEQANADGLDVAEFERRLAQPIDLPMDWVEAAVLSHSTIPARGYKKQTRLITTTTKTGALRYRQLNKALCIKDSCGCRGYIEAEISVELKTLDGAVQATTQGKAWQRLTVDDDDPDRLSTAIQTRADLREVVGTLRFTPPGRVVSGSLVLSTGLAPAAGAGFVSIYLQVEHEEDRKWDGTTTPRNYALSVQGAFPNEPMAE